MHTRPDAAPVDYCADRDDVHMKEAGAGVVLCEALVDCTLEGLEVSLRESEDVLLFVKFDGGSEEHCEIALNLGDEFAGRGIL